MSAATVDARTICRRINEASPEGGLFQGDRGRVDSHSRLPWRIAPEPFRLTADQVEYLDRLGHALHAFYHAANQLYRHSVLSRQPAWIHEYLDQGKPRDIVDLGRMNRFRSQLPLVIRPDLLLTAHGFRVAELDAVPGGMGFTAQVSRRYAEQGFRLVGGDLGLVDGLYQAVADGAGAERPRLAVVVSDESQAYRAEMEWLASDLRERGMPVFCCHPRDLHFDEDGLFLRHHSVEDPVRLDAVYRFWELFDLKNIPKAELVTYFAKKNAVWVTPPLKAYLEEKLWLALFHHPLLHDAWDALLDPVSRQILQEVIPPTWIVDPRPLPPHAVIGGLQIGGRPLHSWDELARLSRKQRQFVIKPSGFSATACESRGVSVGHDLPADAWATRLQKARDGFYEGPSVLQRFEQARRVTVSYYDFAEDRMRLLHGRALVRPYYYVHGGMPRLAGVQAVICPADKKVLHGMAEAVLVPCSLEEQAVGTPPGRREPVDDHVDGEFGRCRANPDGGGSNDHTDRGTDAG